MKFVRFPEPIAKGPRNSPFLPPLPENSQFAVPLFLLSQKCSQNPTTGADKPNHLQPAGRQVLVCLYLPRHPGSGRGNLRRPASRLQEPHGPYKKAEESFPLLLDPRPLRCGGRTVSGLASASSPSFSSPHRETRGERPAVAEQGEEDVSPLLTSSLSAAAVVPRPLSGTYRQRATEQDAAVRPDLSPPRWRFLGGRLL